MGRLCWKRLWLKGDKVRGTPPPRTRISGKREPILVVLGKGAQLYPHHLEGDEYNFTTVFADVVMNPLSLKNLSGRTWTAMIADGTSVEVPRGNARVNRWVPCPLRPK